MATTVINLKGRLHELGPTASGITYIGRHQHQGGWDLRESEWHNPFWADKPGRPRDGTHEEVVGLFLTYLHCVRPDLLARVGELRERVLGCWCVPELCHGDALATLAEEEG